ncbi:MAG TPA: hypothetical protein VNT79_08700 [Phycisphaerae bacterium]|nr:hypothetical protein [Phycisphaerae bacterium]
MLITNRSPKGTCAHSTLIAAAVCITLGLSARIAFAGGNGACCVAGGGVLQCFDGVSEAECTDMGGVFHGPDTGCAPATCSGGGPGPQGACCVMQTSSSACFSAIESHCANQGGTWFGENSICDEVIEQCMPDPQPVGACCLDVNGGFVFCFETSLDQCGIFDGEFHGEGTTCEQVGCVPGGGDPVGACCAAAPAGNACVETTAAQCAEGGGEYHGDDVPCSTDICPTGPGGPVGACCTTMGGGHFCLVITAADCADVSGHYQGDDTVCDGSSCDGDSLVVRRTGDLNGDGAANLSDVPAFTQALIDAEYYELYYPQGDLLNGDTDRNELVNGADIAGFVESIGVN